MGKQLAFIFVLETRALTDTHPLFPHTRTHKHTLHKSLVVSGSLACCFIKTVDLLWWHVPRMDSRPPLPLLFTGLYQGQKVLSACPSSLFRWES